MAWERRANRTDTQNFGGSVPQSVVITGGWGRHCCLVQGRIILLHTGLDTGGLGMLLNSLDRSFVVQKAKTGCYVQGAKEDRQRQGMPTAGASRAVRTSSNL